MSTETRYRFTVDCDCFGCKLAAFLNAEKPEGFSAEDLLDLVVGMSPMLGAALSIHGAASATIPATPPSLTPGIIQHWTPRQ